MELLEKNILDVKPKKEICSLNPLLGKILLVGYVQLAAAALFFAYKGGVHIYFAKKYKNALLEISGNKAAVVKMHKEHEKLMQLKKFFDKNQKWQQDNIPTTPIFHALLLSIPQKMFLKNFFVQNQKQGIWTELEFLSKTEKAKVDALREFSKNLESSGYAFQIKNTSSGETNTVSGFLKEVENV